MRRLLLLIIVSLTILAGCSTASESGRTFSGPKPADSTTPKTTTTTTDPEAVARAEEAKAAEAKAAEALQQTTAADYEQAVVKQLSSKDGGVFFVETTEAECVAPRWVEAMGVERLKEKGITAEDLSSPSFAPSEFEFGFESGEAMVGSFGECSVDLGVLAVRSLGAPNATVETCMIEALDRNALLALVARDIGGEDTDAEVQALLVPLTTTCT